MTEIERIIRRLRYQCGHANAVLVPVDEMRMLLDYIERSDALLREAERAMLWTAQEYKKARIDW